MFKFKKWQLWLTFGISLALACGIIAWALLDPYNKTTVTILLVIVFLVMTFSLQMAIMATFKFKPKKRKLKSKVYNITLEEIINNLDNEGFKRKNNRFGYIYYKIDNKTAYKATFITDAEEYLKKVENEQSQSLPGIKNCTKLVGFEIFTNINDTIRNSLADYSFLGNKIYYEGFFIENNELFEVNIIEINDNFIKEVTYFKELVGAKDVQAN